MTQPECPYCQGELVRIGTTTAQRPWCRCEGCGLEQGFDTAKFDSGVPLEPCPPQKKRSKPKE